MNIKCTVRHYQKLDGEEYDSQYIDTTITEKEIKILAAAKVLDMFSSGNVDINNVEIGGVNI